MSARYGRRIRSQSDRNSEQVVAALRAMGCTVESIQGSTGTPDLLVGVFGLTELVEVKPPIGSTGDKRKESPRESQQEWHARWKGRKPVVVRNLDDCAALVSRMRGALTRNEVSTTGALNGDV